QGRSGGRMCLAGPVARPSTAGLIRSMSVTALFRRLLPALAVVVLAGAAGACSSVDRFALPPDSEQRPDAFLHARGTEALEAGHWLTAREYFRRLVDTYPTSE